MESRFGNALLLPLTVFTFVHLINSEDFLHLPRLNPVSIGHEQTMHLESGRTLTIKTLAVNPPIFEIEDYLTNIECDHIIALAMASSKWTESTIKGKVDKDKEIRKFNFTQGDKNNDNLLDHLELWYVMPRLQNSLITIKSIPEFVQLYNYDVDGDEKLTNEEFDRIDINVAFQWIENKMKKDKKNVIRLSKQVWLNHDSDEVLRSLKTRVVSLTRLPKGVVDTSEQLQVAQYDVGGHYHGHFDTSKLDKRKCLHSRELDGIKLTEPYDAVKYRLCRYATLMYYLNDVDEGGETAFPVADNATVSEKVIRAGGNIGDLSNHCTDANLVVKPKKGKAVLWYNHLHNKDGWVGDKDPFSYHGGCDIVKGVKWIANHWITVDTDKQRHIRLMNLREKRYRGVERAKQEYNQKQEEQAMKQKETQPQQQEQRKKQHQNLRKHHNNQHLPQSELIGLEDKSYIRNEL
ncbi:transmembrane prolyl 4-hydroxylase-like [Antedon mediterranea]|uniref:transmembrane prolyl 4-hydroxylase-like n=1 Tax=Antedon mediterranea TaxID=105859 RepID=UPI003AF9EB7A